MSLINVNQRTAKRASRSHLWCACLALLVAFSAACKQRAPTTEPTPADAVASPAFIDVALLGTWQNVSGSGTVALAITGARECELRMSRPLGEALAVGCEYAAVDDFYELYLKDASGQCSSLADFIFYYDASLPSITLAVEPAPIALFRTTAQ